MRDSSCASKVKSVGTGPVQTPTVDGCDCDGLAALRSWFVHERDEDTRTNGIGYIQVHSGTKFTCQGARDL